MAPPPEPPIDSTRWRGHPIVVAADYNPDPKDIGPPNNLGRVKEGEKFVLLQLSPDDQWVEVQRLSGQEHFWIPKKHTRLGRLRKVGFHIVEHQYDADRDSLIWTVTEVPGVADVYAGKPVKCVVDSRTKTRLLHTIGSFRITMEDKEGPGPSHNDLVYITVQVSKNGAQSSPYGRFPNVGYWSDHVRLNQVAIQIMWQANEIWYSRFLQASDTSNSTETLMPSTKGVCRNAPVVAGLLYYLERKQFNPPHPYAENFGFARVKKDELDFLNQILTYRDDTSLERIPTPRPRTHTELMSDLRRLSPSHATTFGGWQAFPPLPGAGLTSVQRDDCDRCHVSKIVSGTGQDKCEKVRGKDVCTCCDKFGFQECTWTHSATLLANVPLQHALWYHSPRDLGKSMKDFELGFDPRPTAYNSAAP